ncbi:hypothetical protein GC177_03075 [bacterium]|nr:hypothetical protein [bacterium]
MLYLIAAGHRRMGTILNRYCKPSENIKVPVDDGRLIFKARGLNRVASASVPRTGHHMLQQMLEEYFGERHSYCQYYDGPQKRADCCNQFPCVHPDVNFQKNHDLDRKGTSTTQYHYLVQYRHPLKATVSSFLEGLSYQPHMRNNYEYWRHFARGEFNFYKSFVKRWMKAYALPHALYVEYDDFMQRPIKVFSQIVSFFEPDAEPDLEKISKIIAKKNIISTKSFFDFHYFDLDYFVQLERYVSQELRELKIPFQLIDEDDYSSSMLETGIY